MRVGRFSGRFVTVFVTVVLAFTLLASAAALGGITDSSAAPQVDNAVAAAEDDEVFEPAPTGSEETKLSSSVQSTLSDSDSDADSDSESGSEISTANADHVPVIVVFSTQPEDELPLHSLSATEAGHEMQTLAAETQGPFLRYLKEQKQQGKAANVESLYLRNAIALEADADVIHDLASSSLVERVIYDEKVSALSDDDSQTDIEAFYSQFVDTDNASVDPTGFERVATGERAQNIEEVGATSVHQSGIIGDGVNVSVIDTGINDTHPALEGQVVKRADFVENETDDVLIDESSTDPNGHGTHVAGTVAGVRDAEQAVGVAPGADLFDARVLDEHGGGQISDIIMAFEWSEDNHADVASASLGLSPGGDAHHEQLTIDSGAENNTSVRVYESMDEVFEGNISENHSVGETFKPGSMFIAVDSIEVLNDSTLETADATQNLTLTVESPNGTQTLEQHDAGFLAPFDEIPDDVLIYKYKPSDPQVLENGNWSVGLNNSNDVDVEATIDTLTLYPPDGTDDVSQAVNNLESTGTIPVVASGNLGIYGNQTVGSPAVAENAISVGASQPNSIDVAPFSSRGPVGFGDDVRPGVDLIAPGVDIVSAGSPEAFVGDEEYVRASGTSMAAPHVSGTIALMLSADESLERSTIETTLTETAQSPPRPESVVGGGALDAFAAVDNVTEEQLTADENAEGVDELYAGIGDTSRSRLRVDLDPVTDPVGDAGTAPDFETAFVDVDTWSAEFRVGLADDTAPNATFVTYIDADQNDTTGDQSEHGADYRLNFTRTLTGSSYEGTIDVYEYDSTTDSYERTTDVEASAHESSFEHYPEYIEYSIRTSSSSGINTTAFDWHVVSNDPDSTSADRLPDEGQEDTEHMVSVPGIGVAWNATAGTPATDQPLSFELSERFDDSVIEDATVQTDSTGIAKTSFNISSLLSQRYTVTISDDRSNTVEQRYRVNDPVIDRGPELRDPSEPIAGDNIRIHERDYEVRHDESVEINIPVYTIESEEITPYNGNASIQIEDWNEEDTINNLTVEDGVLTTEITPEESPAFSSSGIDRVDIEVALASNYSEAATTYSGGDITARSVDYESTLAPITQVTQPQTSAELSFQTTESNSTDFQQNAPSNVSSQYTTWWVTDRVTASVYDELPDSVAAKLDEAQRTDGQIELTRSDRETIKRTIQNVSAQGIAVETSEGNVTPDERGIGQFNVTPPEDARFGITEIEPNTPDDTASSSFDSVVFVDQRIEEYQRTPTKPESAEYTLAVRGNWDSDTTDDYVVPNESIDVTVDLYDHAADEPVPNTQVKLYTTGGDTTTVTTDEDGTVETEIDAPDIDYLNRSFHFQRQQVLGIAEGIQNDDGSSVSDIEWVFSSAYERTDSTDDTDDAPEGTYADPDLSYDEANETIGLDVDYRNRTTDELTNATTALTVLGTPSVRFGTEDDLLVEYLGTNTNETTISREITESVPDDQRRVFEVTTNTASDSVESHRGERASLFFSGPFASFSGPEQISPNSSESVSVELTDRDGEPLTNATVLLEYAEINENLDDELASTAGNALTASTDANGVATFTISPELAGSDSSHIELRASYATDSAALRGATFDTIEITDDSASEDGIVIVPFFEATPQNGLVDDEFTFNASGAAAFENDTETEFDSITWEFGDGTTEVIDTPEDDPTITHSYADSGSYVVNATFEVDNTTATYERDLSVFEPLELTATPTEADVNVTEVQFSADRDSGEFSWDVTGDGEPEAVTDESTFNYTYTELGEFDATVEDIDAADGQPAEANVTVDVVDTVDPDADLTLPADAAVEQEVTANASGSTDNHQIANYTWEIVNETGSVVGATTTDQPVLDFSLNNTGEFSVELTVTDESGNEDTTSESITVTDGAALDLTLSADAEQEIGAVTAETNVTNVGSQSTGEDVTVELLANGTTYDGDVITETFETDIESLDADQSVDVNFSDLDDWVADNRVVDDLALSAEADPDGDVSESTEETTDTGVITVLYADLTASSDASNVTQGENATLRSYVANNGTAVSDTTTASVTVTDESNETVFENDSVSIDELAADGLQRDRFTESFDQPGNHTLHVNVTDDRFPEGTESSTEFVVEPYELGVVDNATSVRSDVSSNQNFTAVFGYESNTDEDVNATLELPDELEFADDETADERTVTASPRADRTDIVRYDLTANETSDTPVDLNFSVEDTADLGEDDDTSTQTNISVVTETVTNESAVTYNGTDETTTIEVYGEDASEDHNVSLSVQGGPEGRTLQGLEYLVNYPYGCVEQTTSAFLGALNTHQYYDDRDDTNISDDRQDVINGSIEQGVDRLAEGGVRSQQDDGSWNQWGREGQDGQTYFSVLALYGLSQVDNDDKYSDKNDERLDDVGFNEAVEWLNEDDNWQEVDGYLRDDPSALGFAIISLEEARESDRTNESTEATIDEIYADAGAELIDKQDEAHSGTWEDENHRSTAFAVYGLQLTLDAGVYEDNETQQDVEAAVENGSAFLASAQDEDGAWEPYYDSPYWNNQGDISKSTAISSLALDAVDNGNIVEDGEYQQEIDDGVDYLMDVYESDGSWGYPRATNMALEALIELTGDAADRTMEITLEGPDGEINETVSVDPDNPQIDTKITNELQTLRADNDGLEYVDVTVSSDGGTGSVIVAVQTTQEVHEASLGGDDQ